jgi:hypothetical protein
MNWTQVFIFLPFLFKMMVKEKGTKKMGGSWSREALSAFWKAESQWIRDNWFSKKRKLLVEMGKQCEASWSVLKGNDIRFRTDCFDSNPESTGSCCVTVVDTCPHHALISYLRKIMLVTFSGLNEWIYASGHCISYYGCCDFWRTLERFKNCRS